MDESSLPLSSDPLAEEPPPAVAVGGDVATTEKRHAQARHVSDQKDVPDQSNNDDDDDDEDAASDTDTNTDSFDILTSDDFAPDDDDDGDRLDRLAEEVTEKETGLVVQAIQGLEASQDDPFHDRASVLCELTELRTELHDWTLLRAQTIGRLRQIADYMDVVGRRTGLAKIVGSGGGALAGGLTLVGGLMTIATAGAALPVLIAGTGLGLASGVTGGVAAITDKIIKSRQMKEAEAALAADEAATKHLEERVAHLRRSKFAKKIATQALLSGAGAAYESSKMLSMVTSGGVGMGKIGGEVVAKIFGEDVGKEVSKVLLQTSGRVLSGSVTVVLGGVTMLYDIYRLNAEVQSLAGLGEEGAHEIRTIANQLQRALAELVDDDADADADADKKQGCNDVGPAAETRQSETVL